MKRYIKSDSERGYFYDRLTENGKKTWRDVEDFPSLFKNYDEMTGFVTIPEPEFKAVQPEVNAFLEARPDWIIYFNADFPWYDDDGVEYEGCYGLCESGDIEGFTDYEGMQECLKYNEDYRKRYGL